MTESQYLEETNVQKQIMLSAAKQEIFYSKDKIWILRKAYPFGLLLKNVSILVKFIYSEKATIFCEISTVDLSYVVYGGDFVSDFMNFKMSKVLVNKAPS